MNSSHSFRSNGCDIKQGKTPSLFSRLSVGLLGSSVCALLFVGCGSADQNGKSQSAPTVTTDQEAATSPRAEITEPANTNVAAGPVNSSKTAGPTGEDAQATSISNAVALPTAEQIARWTPAPFEPLQLVAIREWDKTSFTRRLAATPDGKHFIAAGSRVLLWQLAGEQPAHVFLDLAGDDADRDILALAVSPDGRWLSAGDSKGMLRVWSLDDRKETVARQLGPAGIQSLAISPDGEEIATISFDNQVKTWTANTLAPKKEFKVDTNGLERIEYMAAGMLAAAGESTSLWNTATGQLAQKLSPGRYSFALARSPDGTRFIFGGVDSLRIWNIAEAKQEAEIKQAVSGSERLAFSPDGKFLATSTGRSVQIWNLTERRVAQVIDSFGWPIVDLTWLPQSNLLAVASDIGCTRIWGTVNQGAAQGLKPLHAPVAMPNAASKSPATIWQLEQVIDLRTFPRLPDSEPSLVGPSNFSCVAPVPRDEAKSFYKYFLEKDGWTAAVGSLPNPAAMEFRKNGSRLSVSCYEAGPGKTNVILEHRGSYDLRWTPKFDAAPVETVYESDNTVSYRTKADLVQIETWLLRKLHAAGWTGYTQLNSSYLEEPDQRDMSFLRNGTSLRVSINRFPASPDRFTISYTRFALNSAAPVPSDSGYVEFDGSTEPALVATTKMTLDEAGKFYDAEMEVQGWLIRRQGRSTKEDQAWLSYIRGQCDMTVGLTKLADGRTLVRIGQASGSLWELSQAKTPAAGKTDDAGLQAADFPAISGAKPPKFDALAKSVELQIEKTSLAQAAEQFTEKLTGLGWMPEKGGIRSEDYTFFKFKKDDQEIALRARLQNGNAVVNFQGDGLLWTKELPGGKQVVSYETWLRQNKHPAGLELLDRYEKEMRAIKPPSAEKSPSG